MDELKPCPFCGGEAECTKWWSATMSGKYATVCKKCSCGTDYYYTEAEAIEAWNTRAERTCRNARTYGYGFRFECCECGYTTIVHNCTVRLDELPKYCPNCGARVVER